MEIWIELLLPFMLLLARISAFLMVLPIFGWRMLPVRIRAGIAMLLSIFFAIVIPSNLSPQQVQPLMAAMLLAKELVCGLALGLAARIVFMAVGQAGRFAGRQMGFALATIIDPVSGAQASPMETLFQVTFAVFFLAAGGHHLLLSVIARSYQAFPMGDVAPMAEFTEGIVRAGSAMMLFMLKLVAPLLAAFLVLSAILGILARALPEMNVLMASLPLRVALGFLIAAAMMPMLNAFAGELAQWMGQYLLS